jgi:hypothetical protein
MFVIKKILRGHFIIFIFFDMFKIKSALNLGDIVDSYGYNKD